MAITKTKIQCLEWELYSKDIILKDKMFSKNVM